ncbi:MAG: single-stranded-DNA-specific exonuclease RecJ [Pelosinus sp.]|nr:single-stranded-DNA-specific exonuclease RecJ [Pelosinus sp.]
MSKLHKEWRLLPEQPELSERLSTKLHVSKIISQVLINRGIQDEAMAEKFLYGGSENFHDAFLLKDMTKAAARIIEAKDNNEKIAIYGDYDVDGVTSTALMYMTLLRMGIDQQHLVYYIPEREKEGYGLNQVALTKLSHAGATLVITVDCGISAVDEISDAATAMDFIITDHHQPPEILPEAFAIINPKQVDCFYPDKNLAGVGVAFKLCQALSQQILGADEPILDLLDLVAVGTVADIVPLTGENRILVKRGLEKLVVTRKIGLVKLLEECKILPDKLDAGKIGFIIAPRLNAAGRVGKADTGVELLITADEERASYLAGFLEQENLKRQDLEKKILLMAESTLLENGWDKDHVFVLSGEDWHPGVIGIVASRLVEKYYRPVVMISVKEGAGKGSCRSIAGFDIYQALSKCSDLLIKFGGHRQAAGLSLAAENIEKLRQRLNAIADTELTPADYQPVLKIDSMVALDEIDSAFLEQLTCLAPHGMGNPAPVFACKDLLLDDVRTIGQDGRHLKLRVRNKNGVTDVLAWQMGEMAEGIQRNNMVDVAFVPEFNEWQGHRSIQLRAHDVVGPKVVYDREELYRTLRINNLFLEGIVQKDVETAHNNLLTRKRSYIDERAGHNLSLKDMRNAADKVEYLIACVENGEKTVIYVNTHKEACQLFETITNMAPQLKEQTGVYSGLLSGEWLRQIEAWFSENKLSVIIATNLYCQVNECTISQVIFWSMPVNRLLFEQQCLQVYLDDKIGMLHLLFGEADLAAAFSGMKRDLPDRELIGYFYLMLKRCITGKSIIAVTNTELAEKLNYMYHGEISIYGVKRALTILEELQLVRQEGQGAQRKIYLSPPPQQKLDITSSAVFQAGAQQKIDLQDFAEKMMHVTIEEILSWLTRQ